MSSLLCLYSLPGELTQALGSSLPLYFFPFSLPHFSLSDLALCKTTKLLRYLAQLFLLFFFFNGVGMGRIWFVGERGVLCSFSH